MPSESEDYTSEDSRSSYIVKKNNKQRNSSNSYRNNASTSRSRDTKPKSGRQTRNPFLNFLIEFRKTRIGQDASKIAREGGFKWRQMSKNEKYPYITMAEIEKNRKKKKVKRLHHKTKNENKNKTSKRRR